MAVGSSPVAFETHLNKLNKAIYNINKIYGTHFLIITFYSLFATFY